MAAILPWASVPGRRHCNGSPGGPIEGFEAPAYETSNAGWNLTSPVIGASLRTSR